MTLGMLEGDYYHEIAPRKDKLDITLTCIPLTAGETPSEDPHLPRKSFRYKATLWDGRNPTLESNNPLASDKEKANRGSFTDVQFQLIHPVIEYLRTKTVGGVFKDIAPVHLIRGILTQYSQQAVVDDAIRVKGVTIVPRGNPEPRSVIEIPHRTALLDVPRYVEEKAGGCYPTGFDFYLQGNFWYLFSPFDLKAFERSPRTLTILNVPAGRFPSPEASYRITPQQVIILATGETKHNDVSEELQLNAGNGVAFIDASKVMEDMGTVSGNKLNVDSANHVNETMIDPRENGLNVIKQAPKKITSNFMKEYSQLAIRSGGFVQLSWENGDPDLLYPGMATKLMYVKNNEAVETYGVLVGTDTFDLPNSNHIGQRRFTKQTVLTLFIDRKSP